MRRKRSNRGDITIDLTSLLDVIFILLLVVLFGQHNINAELGESKREAEKAQAEAVAERTLYEDMIDTADQLNQFVCAVSIVASYDEMEITKRSVQLLVKGETAASYDLIGNTDKDVLNDFKEKLIEYISQNSKRPVILSLNEDDNKILYRDEVAINNILSELSKEYGNVYIKGNLNKE